MIDARRHIIPAIVAVALGAPTLWWLMDRDPPYVRESGEIVAAAAKDCGLPDTAPTGLRPGACASAEWKIEHKRACRRYGEFNISRTLTDAKGGKHTLPATSSLHGSNEASGDLNRFFAIPTITPFGNTQYISSACFACNPLQHLIFPICVDTPTLEFVVEEAPK